MAAARRTQQTARRQLTNNASNAGEAAASKAGTTPSSSAAGAGSGAPQQPVQKLGKLKQMYKQYGRPAVYTYLGISTIDLGLSFAAVYSGVDVERFVDSAKSVLSRYGLWQNVVDQDDVKELQDMLTTSETDPDAYTQQQLATAADSNGVDKAKGQQSLLTTFLIAYAFHKLLMPIRIPLTVAITPTMVRLFRNWGFVKDGVAASKVIQAAAGQASATPSKLSLASIAGLLSLHPPSRDVRAKRERVM
ncbi:DUF1279 superfamily [Sorochytrium milnesiophthora]